MDQTFNVDTLHELRKAVLAEAIAAGMSHDQAVAVMLAVHELAANAVRHGGGGGRARMQVAAGELRCQVSDGSPVSVDGGARRSGAEAVESWPVQRGRGLWLVRNVASCMSVAAGLAGSEVTVVFTVPGVQGGAPGQ